jgi:hypothetical protein
MTTGWHVGLAYALVGFEVDLPASATPDAAVLVADLAAIGWDADRIGDHARETAAAEQPWPHPVPAWLRQDCGAAQFHAALARTRVLLGLVTLETRPPSGRSRLNADEERLMREVPPHHGH